MLVLFADAEPWHEPLAAGNVITFADLLLRSVKRKTP